MKNERNKWSLHSHWKPGFVKLPRIIVVGAGMAGIVCARILHDTGFQVIVLEARNRLGGRIWTDNSLGVSLDLGASWIHNAPKNPLTKWCRVLGIPCLKWPERKTTFMEEGRPFSFSRLLWEARRTTLKAGLHLLSSTVQLDLKNILGQESDLPVYDVFAPLLMNSDIKPRDRHMLCWIVSMIEAIHSAPADEMSLYELDFGEYWQKNLVPAGGFARLINNAAKGLEIRLTSEVKKISIGADTVHVATDDQHHQCDVAVVAVPLGVLKANGITFDPPLQPAKRAAVERIGYGGNTVLNRIAFRFPERIWRKGMEKVAVLPQSLYERGLFPVWMDLERVTGTPMVEGFYSGSFAARLDQEAPVEEVQKRALAVIARMLGQPVPEPEGCCLTRWLSDPYSRGSYSYTRVGSSAADREILAEPIADRLYFTGEASHTEHYGTVQGALLAGEREASRIHKRYCCPENSRSNLPWCKKAT